MYRNRYKLESVLCYGSLHHVGVERRVAGSVNRVLSVADIAELDHNSRCRPSILPVRIERCTYLDAVMAEFFVCAVHKAYQAVILYIPLIREPVGNQILDVLKDAVLLREAVLEGRFLCVVSEYHKSENALSQSLLV